MGKRNYTVDNTARLENALKSGYRSLATQLRLAGTPSRQHNVEGRKSRVAKATSTPAKKTAVKKSAAKKTSKAPAKKAAKKS